MAEFLWDGLGWRQGKEPVDEIKNKLIVLSRNGFGPRPGWQAKDSRSHGHGPLGKGRIQVMVFNILFI
jgi:hypothetical protein